VYRTVALQVSDTGRMIKLTLGILPKTKTELKPLLQTTTNKITEFIKIIHCWWNYWHQWSN